MTDLRAVATIKKKKIKKAFEFWYIGVAMIFDWGTNYKSHAMMSSEIFERKTFCGTKMS